MSNKTNACRKLDSLHIKYTLHEYDGMRSIWTLIPLRTRLVFLLTSFTRPLCLGEIRPALLRPAFREIRS